MNGPFAEFSAVLCVGAGTVMIDERELFKQFAPFGVSFIAFRKFRRAMGVTAVFMPDGTVLVDLLSFQIMMRGLNAIGNGDILFPGFTQRSWERNSKKKPAHTTTKMPTPAFIKANLKDFVMELLLARRLDYARNTKLTKEALDRACNRITLALAQLLADKCPTARASLLESDLALSITEPSLESPVPPPDDPGAT